MIDQSNAKFPPGEASTLCDEISVFAAITPQKYITLPQKISAGATFAKSALATRAGESCGKMFDRRGDSCSVPQALIYGVNPDDQSGAACEQRLVEQNAPNGEPLICFDA